jgi:serine/threonine protein kinase
VLESYARQRDETASLRVLAHHDILLEYIMHCRTWFFQRHVNMAMRQKNATIREEAAAFFLLDAAADAARSYFARHPEDVTAAALKGLWILAADLSNQADPMGLRACIGQRVTAWHTLVKQHGETQRAKSARGGPATGSPERPRSVEPRSARMHVPNTARPYQRVDPEAALLAKPLKARKPASDPARALKPLGYEVLGPIAAGAFSTILRCRAPPSGGGAAAGGKREPGVEVAVKSFDASKCAKDETLATCRDNELEVLRMLRWASEQSAAKRGHPHIANMLDVLGGPDDSHIHAVLEYCDGGTLKRYLQTLQKSVPSGVGIASEEAGMAPDMCAKATGQLASALFHLHMLGVSHGDIKPANIMLLHQLQTWAPGTGSHMDPSRLHLKLCDFGFACICGDDKLRSYCGTPAYLAPEVVTPADAHRGYLGKPVDMWALGCVVYEMMHGRMAFPSQHSFELEAAVRGGHHSAVKASASASSKAVLAGLLKVDAEQRLTAQQLVERPWVQEALKPTVSVGGVGAAKPAEELPAQGSGAAAGESSSASGGTSGGGNGGGGNGGGGNGGGGIGSFFGLGGGGEDASTKKKAEVSSPTATVTSQGSGGASRRSSPGGKKLKARSKASPAGGSHSTAAAAAAAAAASTEGFVPAPKFGGQRAGMVFKAGPAGVGYYPDMPLASSAAAGAPMASERMMRKPMGKKTPRTPSATKGLKSPKGAALGATDKADKALAPAAAPTAAPAAAEKAKSVTVVATPRGSSGKGAAAAASGASGGASDSGSGGGGSGGGGGFFHPFGGMTGFGATEPKEHAPSDSGSEAAAPTGASPFAAPSGGSAPSAGKKQIQMQDEGTAPEEKKYRRPEVERNPYAQAPPRSVRSARGPGTGRQAFGGGARQASARAPPLSGRKAPPADARTRGPAGGAAARSAGAASSQYPGLSSEGQPTPANVSSAGVAQAVQWLREHGEAHPSFAEGVLPRLAAHCQGQGGVAAPLDAEVVAQGGIPAVLNAMAAHPANERVQAFGCMLMGLLCDRETRTRQAKDSGAARLVCAALRAHKTIDVMTSGCLAIGQLAALPPVAKECAESGAVNLVVAAMRAKPGRPALQANACMALANLIIGEARASDHAQCQLAADIGALECIVDALVRFPTHDGVLHWATTAMLRLTHESAERAQLAIAAGAKDALHLAFSQPQIKSMPTIAAKVELAHKWLTMHEKVGEHGAGAAGSGDANPEQPGDSIMSKAEKVYKALLFEHATGESELVAAA